MSEEWHKTHAVLLKSVAEAQGKLLAGINALESKLDRWKKEPTDERHAVLCKKLDDLHLEQVCHNRNTREDWASLRTAIDERPTREQIEEIKGRLDALGNCLAGLLTLGAKAPSTKRKPRGRRKV
jgi:hypothetical protein